MHSWRPRLALLCLCRKHQVNRKVVLCCCTCRQEAHSDCWSPGCRDFVNVGEALWCLLQFFRTLQASLQRSGCQLLNAQTLDILNKIAAHQSKPVVSENILPHKLNAIGCVDCVQCTTCEGIRAHQRLHSPEHNQQNLLLVYDAVYETKKHIATPRVGWCWVLLP